MEPAQGGRNYLDLDSGSSIGSRFPEQPQVPNKKKPTQKQIVLALAPFVCIETRENEKGKEIEYVVRECPNKKYCKNPEGRIRYQNKCGYKNPHLHLRTCVARVSTPPCGMRLLTD